MLLNLLDQYALAITQLLYKKKTPHKQTLVFVAMAITPSICLVDALNVIVSHFSRFNHSQFNSLFRLTLLYGRKDLQ